MRNLTKKIGGKQVALRASFGASIKLMDQVGDPLMIVQEAGLAALRMSKGMTYNPKWNFTVENVPLIIFIGHEEAGGSMTMEEIQELVFAEGFNSSRLIAAEYLSLIVEPKSSTPATKKAKAVRGKSSLGETS